MPKEICEKYKFISLDKAIREIHFPKNKDMLNEAILRLKFQELFTYSIKLLLLKKNIKGNSEGISFPWKDEMKALKASLPYNLTNAMHKKGK